jgi:hypothetical protein
VRQVDETIGQGLAGADEGQRHSLQLLDRDGPAVYRQHVGQPLRDDVDHGPPHPRQLRGEGFSRTRLAVDDGPTVPMGADIAEEPAQPPPQLLVGWQVCLDDARERLQHPAGLPAQARHEQLVLRPEVRVHHRFRHAGPFGDLVHVRGVESPRGEDSDGGVEHLLLAHASGESLPHPC